jgi:hypothetical protein
MTHNKGRSMAIAKNVKPALLVHISNIGGGGAEKAGSYATSKARKDGTSKR